MLSDSSSILPLVLCLYSSVRPILSKGPTKGLETPIWRRGLSAVSYKRIVLAAAKEPIVQLCEEERKKNIEGRGSFPGGLVTSRALRHCRSNLDILHGSGMSIKGPESFPDNRTSAGL